MKSSFFGRFAVRAEAILMATRRRHQSVQMAYLEMSPIKWSIYLQAVW